MGGSAWWLLQYATPPPIPKTPARENLTNRTVLANESARLLMPPSGQVK
jgi:hypothetical protein